jgi:hypothetical protein
MHSFQSVLQLYPAAGLQRAEHATRHAAGVAGLQAAEVCAVGVALGGVAAEAEGLQVAEVVRATLVFGDDVVHLQGPLMRGLPSNSLRRSIRSGPWPG